MNFFKNKEKSLPSVATTYILFFVILFILGYLAGIKGYNLKLMTLLCIVISVIVGYFHGTTWEDLMPPICRKVSDSAPMFLILLGIGYLIASYMMAGTAPVLVSWMTKLISPSYIVVLTFVLCAIFSWAVGTSFGTLGTLGIIMFSVASVLGVTPGLAAAAVVCGINFGGLLSPFNDSMASLPAVYGGSVSDMIRYNLPTTAISAGVSVIFFFVAGLKFSGGITSESAEMIDTLTKSVSNTFSSNPIILLPLILAIVFVFLKIDIIINLFVSGTVGLIIGVTVQGFKFSTCLGALYSGFNTADFFPDVEIYSGLAGLLNRGGMFGMADAIIFILLMVSLGAVLTEIGIFKVISTTVFKNVKNAGALNLLTGAACGVLTCVTLDGIPTGIVAKDMFSETWSDNGYDPKTIMKFPQIWGNCVGNIAPWGFCANYFAGVLGVPIVAWLPMCIFLWLNPLLAMFSAFFLKLDKLPEVQAEKQE